MKAKAAVFMGADQPFQVREFDVTPAPAGYGASRLIASGVCGTDIHFHRGKLQTSSPSIIGHEFIGTLFDLDEAEGIRFGLKKGDNVIADIAVPCGECLLCKNGDDANCVNMQVTNGGSIDAAPYLYGGFTQVNYTPLSNLVRIPDQLDPAMVATFACPGPTVLHAFALARQANIDLVNVHTAIVQGLGPVGVFAVLYLKAMGVENVWAITARENPERDDLIRSLGADGVFALSSTTTEELTALVQRQTNGLGADLVFEASGAPSAIPVGMELLRNRGVYIIPGQYSNSGGVSIQPQMITFKALQILGSSQYAMKDVKAYMDFLCVHPELHEPIRKLGSRYPVSLINEAIADAEAGKNIKTLLVP